ncbi:MAG: chemotaxis protein CheW [Pirellula sp.]|nr:chemotaxis protein CheW [Pirellula sp.]
MNSTQTPYVTFRCGDSLFGIDIGCVQEINRCLSLTSIPLAPPFVRGVANLRGDVVTMLDLRILMEQPRVESNIHQRSLILHSDGETFGLWVDSVSDIVEIDSDDIVSPPSNIEPSVARLVLGVYSHDSRLILLLDPDALFATTVSLER